MPYRDLLNVILFFLCLTLSVSVVECYKLEDLCKDLTSKSIEHRLKTHLFCDYDEDVRPQIGAKGNVTNVGLMFMPRFISFDDATSVLEMHSWTVVNWTDPLLKWNPEDFEGLDSIQVPSDSLWTPDLIVHTPHDASKGKPGLPKTECGIKHDGRIMCVPTMKFSVNCEPDYTEYPYDMQVCTIELASWAYSTDEIDITMIRKPVTTDLKPGLEWDTLYFSHYMDTNNFKINETLETRIYGLVIVIARRAENMHIVFVVPAFVLMALTLCALWMDCHSNERMIVSSISFICHLICIQRVFWTIPHNGNIAPNLLRYYESSFLIMAFVMFLTVLLREIHAVKSPAPEWLSSTTSLILQSKVGQLLLLSILDPKASAFLEVSADDKDDLIDGDSDDRPKPESNTSTWSYVALLIGWLAFILIFFAYIVMLPMYLPYKPSYDADFIRKLNSQK